MRLGKQAGIGNEAPGLGPAAIEAEAIDLPHSLTSHARCEMPLGLAPGLKCSSIQVGVVGDVAVEESVQRFEGASWIAET
jgi:hypothetical protein